MTTSWQSAFLSTSLVGSAAGVAYARWLKPSHDHWGATTAEKYTTLPGDDLIEDPADQVTRAITIGAPPAAVWPWLAQIGADRGGFYSYDLLENVFGLGVHNAAEIVEDWQEIKVGDVVYANRSRSGGWYVADVRPGELLVLQAADLRRGRPVLRTDPAGWEFQWTFVLVGRGDGTTRLLVRERVALGSLGMRLLMPLLGPVSFLMTRRMLLGIKSRAERGLAAPPVQYPSPVTRGAIR